MKKTIRLTKSRLTAFFCVLAIMLSTFFIPSCQKGENGKDGESTPPDTEQSNYPTVIIDAGHGGEDGGAIGVGGALEKDINLKIALELEQLLRASGISTRLTRSEDILLYDRNSDYQGHKKEQDMAARLAIVKEYESAIFVSIHMNSFPQSKYRGLQVYYSENCSLSRELAQIIQSTATKNLQPENTRKIKPSGDNIYLLKQITHPCVLIECGFLSNPEECALLCSENYRQRLSLSIYSAIMNYFDSLENITADST